MGKGKSETPEQRAKRLAYNREWYRKNRRAERVKRKQRYRLWQRDVQISEYHIRRMEVLERMGGKCKFCSATDSAILFIDHVNNDGANERKSSRNIYYALYKLEYIPPDKYQILCGHCNHKKRIFGDDPKKWPPSRTVSEQLKFLRSKLKATRRPS